MSNLAHHETLVQCKLVGDPASEAYIIVKIVYKLTENYQMVISAHEIIENEDRKIKEVLKDMILRVEVKRTTSMSPSSAALENID